MDILFDQDGWKVTRETSKPNPNGKTRTSVRAQSSDTVSIIAKTNDGRILLLKEYRPYWECYVWMLPSGKVDKEADHDVAAQRELQEETGFRAGAMEKYIVCDYTERFKVQTHIYIAKDLVQDALPPDDDEVIEVHEIALEEAIEKILSGPRVHIASAYALMRYQRDHS